MNITNESQGNTVVLTIEGRIDTITSSKLEETIKGIPVDADKIIMDLEKVEYVSSAGLRVFLSTQKMMLAKNGSMIIRHVCPAIMDIFEVTGFIDILTIEG